MHHDDTTIARHALGELPVEEAAAINAAAATDEALARRVEAARRTLAALSDANAMEPLFRTTKEQRSALYAQGPTAAQAGLGSRVVTAARDALDRAAEVLVAALALDSWNPRGAMPAIRGSDGSRRLVFETSGSVIDVRIEPSVSRLGAFDCVGQVQGALEGEPVVELAWVELDRPERHVAAPDSEGFFEVCVGPGRHAIEVRTPSRTARTIVITHPTDSSGGHAVPPAPATE